MGTAEAATYLGPPAPAWHTPWAAPGPAEDAPPATAGPSSDDFDQRMQSLLEELNDRDLQQMSALVEERLHLLQLGLQAIRHEQWRRANQAASAGR